MQTAVTPAAVAVKSGHRMKAVRMTGALVLMALVLLLAGCKKPPAPLLDHPRSFPGVAIKDVTFFSAALGREMPYRVYLPSDMKAGTALPVVYLLHGGNGGFRDWSNYSDVGLHAKRGLVLVMVEGAFSYYMNAANKPSDRYEDYLTVDLIHDVETRFPVSTNRTGRTVIGISMGGFAAIEFALDRPDLFAFAGAFSPSIDILHRRFHLNSWWRIRTIFGPGGSAARRARDPFVLVQSADPGKTPYLYITAGEQEPLLAPIRRFTGLLKERAFAYEFHTKPGGHDWGEWDAQVPGCFDSLMMHIHPVQP